MTDRGPLHPGQVLTGALFSEPMKVVTVNTAGAGRWVIGLVGARAERFRSVTLAESGLDSLTVVGGDLTFDGDAQLLRLDPASGELRLIEITGLGAAGGRILLTPNERRVAEDRRDCYWLYVVTHCDTTPRLETPVKDPARIGWHPVIKVQHYWLEVDAMAEPMRVAEEQARYDRNDQ